MQPGIGQCSRFGDESSSKFGRSHTTEIVSSDGFFRNAWVADSGVILNGARRRLFSSALRRFLLITQTRLWPSDGGLHSWLNIEPLQRLRACLMAQITHLFEVTSFECMKSRDNAARQVHHTCFWHDILIAKHRNRSRSGQYLSFRVFIKRQKIV